MDQVNFFYILKNNVKILPTCFIKKKKVTQVIYLNAKEQIEIEKLNKKSLKNYCICVCVVSDNLLSWCVVYAS
jgi:translation initiation factor 1 (eIF-1/SUI1)